MLAGSASWQLQWPSVVVVVNAGVGRATGSPHTNSTQSPIAIASFFRSLQMKFVRGDRSDALPLLAPDRAAPPLPRRRARVARVDYVLVAAAAATIM